MARTKVCFIQTWNPHSSKRENELERAKARSHAAIVVAERVKRTKLSLRKSPEISLAIRAKADLPPYHSDSQEDEEKHSELQLPQIREHARDSRKLRYVEDTKEKVLSEDARGQVGNIAKAQQLMRPIPSDHTGLRMDPFYCITGSKDRGPAEVIDFYVQFLLPMYEVPAAVFNVTNIGLAYLESIAKDEIFFHAGIAVVKMFLEQLRRPGSQPSPELLFHRRKALATLRERMEPKKNIEDVATPGAIIFLAIQRLLGNMDGFEAHRRSTKDMVSRKGGLTNIEDGTTSKAVLLQFDFGWSVTTGATLFPNERKSFSTSFPTRPFSADLEALVSRLPEGFQILASQGFFSTVTLGSLDRAAEAYRWSGRDAYSRQIEERRRWKREYNDFCEACPSMSQLETPEEGALDKLVNPLDKLVNLALLATVCNSFTPVRVDISTFSAARMELSRGLDAISTVSKMEDQCMIWIHVAAIDAWRTAGGGLQPEGIQLVDDFRRRYPEIRTATALDVIVRRFFWNLSLLKTGIMICPDDDTGDDTLLAISRGT